MDCIILQLEYIVLGFKDDISVSFKKQKSKGVLMSLDGINGQLIRTLLREWKLLKVIVWNSGCLLKFQITIKVVLSFFQKKKQNKTNLKQWHACVRWLADFILIVQLLIAVVIVSFVLHEIGRTAYYQWLQDPGCWKTKEKQQVFFENLSAAWSYAICVPWLS